MHMRFKFRSAVNFDVVDIGDRPSISVVELKSKIISLKNLNSSHDFDLVFSDSLTAQEYKDENYQIPSNSSVIIRRVPAGLVPAAPPHDLIANLGMKKSNLHGKNGDIADSDDFGIDSCVVQDEIVRPSNVESKWKNICDNEKENIAVLRLGRQKHQAGDLVETIPKGSDEDCTKGKFPPKKTEPNIPEHVKLEKKAVDLYDLAEQNTSLPSELRCPICNKFLRDAVLIPCCQHSFCERCIRGVLSEKAKCPRCSSHKFTEEDLLPNLSLRQAIEHFLESQNQFSISENALRRFVPDEESGIQDKDLSSAVTIVQKRPKKLVYPSAIEKGSSYPTKNLVPDIVSKGVPSFRFKELIGGEGDGYAQHACSQSETGNQPGLADFQGENDPVHLPQIHVQERGEYGKVSAAATYRKADRTCYMCDAPDHFLRDCPFANGSPPMPQTGNSMCAVGGMAADMTPYWNNTAFGPMMPYTTMYAYTGMMPFNASMFPVSPIGVYPYMSYMYGHVPAFGGSPGMAGMAPLVGDRSENPSRHAKYLETRNEIRGNHFKDYMMRRQPCDDEGEDIQMGHHNLPKRSQEYLSHAVRENSGSYSGKKHTQRSRGTDMHGEHFYGDVHSVHDRHGNRMHSVHDRHEKKSRSLSGARDRAYHAEISNLEVEDMSNSSDRYDGEKYSHDHHDITRNYRVRRAHYGSDSSWSRRHGEKDKVKVFSDDKAFIKKHGSQFGPRVEPSSSRDKKKQCKGGDHSRGYNHYRDGTEYIRNELSGRSKMVRRDDDWRDDYYQSKRKRVH
ncbi:E3 ubiquitin ligase PARAQUAT TOLERANCE 3-like [Heracleum sosnowskyi]|uniref:E3 ubiquitin ligase PARAQUAT TOLERANCE 3-like n=1 Tax=Heracleum sosnowskyi TaxID=360622 RepID=A0AAD8MH27_9APIA|nr:E3 ubiquitin ligase PARAQUAT TOLERANCE 3-like [Heracleum sosnowskyi]